MYVGSADSAKGVDIDIGGLCAGGSGRCIAGVDIAVMTEVEPTLRTAGGFEIVRGGVDEPEETPGAPF